MNSLKYAGLALAFATAGMFSASADTTAFDETGGTLTAAGAQGTGGTGLVGFNFTVNTAINVTQLGFYGDALGGGDTPWAALYDVTTSTQLAAITNFSPTNGWLYASLGSPVTLTVGDTYQIVAAAYWSPQYTSTSGFVYGSAINAIGFTTSGGWGNNGTTPNDWGTPTLSTTGIASTPNITANFEYTVAAIPEPATYAALLGLGALGLVVLRRRRNG